VQASDELHLVFLDSDTDSVIAHADTVETAGAAQLRQVRHLAQRLCCFDLFYRLSYPAPQRLVPNLPQVSREATAE